MKVMGKVRYFNWALVAKTVVFVLVIQFCISTQAQPLSSWNLVYSNNLAQITSMAYGNGTFVGFGGGMWFISHDGANWSVYTSPPIINQGGVAYGNGMFMAFGTNYQNKANYVLQSTNGYNWTAIYTSSNTLTAAAYGNNTWVFIGTNEIATVNVSSPYWNWTDYQPLFSPTYISYGNGEYVIASKSGINLYFYTSSDGVAWQYKSVITPPYTPMTLSGIVFVNNVFMIGGYISQSGYIGEAVFSSSDIVNWNRPLGVPQGLIQPASSLLLTSGGNQLYVFVLGQNNQVYSSFDGNLWSSNSITLPNLGRLYYGQGTFVGISGYSIYQSGVFYTNSSPSASSLGLSTYAGITINGTAGGVYQIQYTTNLNYGWQTLTNFMLPYSPYLFFDTSKTVKGQRYYQVVQLQ